MKWAGSRDKILSPSGQRENFFLDIPFYRTFRGLLSVYSRYSLHARQVAYATLYTRGSDDFVSSVAALIATGWSEPAPGRDFHPLRTSAFHGAPQACANAWLRQLTLKTYILMG